MLTQYRILRVICIVALIVGGPYTLWLMGTGNLKLGVPFLLASIVLFIAIISLSKQIRLIRELGNRHIDDNIKPV